MKPRTPIVVTFGGPHFMTIEPLPVAVQRIIAENARLLGSLSDAKDALRAEADRRVAPVEPALVSADRRVVR